MQAKTYLKKAKRIESFIKAKQEELEMLQGRAEGIGAMNLNPDKVQSSPNLTKLQDDIIAISECEDKIKKAIQDLRALHTEITEKIDAIENDDFRLILMLRYLNLKEWEFIAVEMNFSYSHTLFLHKQALKAFQDKHKDFLESKDKKHQTQ